MGCKVGIYGFVLFYGQALRSEPKSIRNGNCMVGSNFKFETGDDAFAVFFVSVEPLPVLDEVFQVVQPCMEWGFLGEGVGVHGLYVVKKKLDFLSLWQLFNALFKSVCFGYLTVTVPISKFVSLNKKMQRTITDELFRDIQRCQFAQLTDRESKILKLLAIGRNNPEISDDLFISRHTVEKHRKNINRKLGIHGFKDILDYAYALI